MRKIPVSSMSRMGKLWENWRTHLHHMWLVSGFALIGVYIYKKRQYNEMVAKGEIKPPSDHLSILDRITATQLTSSGAIGINTTLRDIRERDVDVHVYNLGELKSGPIVVKKSELSKKSVKTLLRERREKMAKEKEMLQAGAEQSNPPEETKD